MSSYNTAANSVTQSSLVWSDAGVAVYGSYNSAYADTTGNGATGTPNGSTSYYDYTVVASQADLEALLGSEYISGAVTANYNISDVIGMTYDGANNFSTDATAGTLTFTMNDVGTTNTGKQVNALYSVEYSGNVPAGFGLWSSFGFAASTSSYIKYTISFEDSDGNSVNGLFLGIISDIDGYEGDGVYGLHDLTSLIPPDSGLTQQISIMGGLYVRGSNQFGGSDDYFSIPLGTFGFSGWGSDFGVVQITGKNVDISEDGTGSELQSGGGFGQKLMVIKYDYAIDPTAPSAKISYVSVDKTVLYELVTPPKIPNTPTAPGTPSTPATPITPATSMTATKAMPLSAKVSNTLPETGDAAGSVSLMYGGFALLGALTFAGVMTRKRRRVLEASEKAAEAASEL